MCKCYVQVTDDLTEIYPSSARKEVITVAARVVKTTRISADWLCRSFQLMLADRLNKRKKSDIKVSDNTTVYPNLLNFNKPDYLLHKRKIYSESHSG
jgi:hypothetical protein